MWTKGIQHSTGIYHFIIWIRANFIWTPWHTSTKIQLNIDQYMHNLHTWCHTHKHTVEDKAFLLPPSPKDKSNTTYRLIDFCAHLKWMSCSTNTTLLHSLSLFLSFSFFRPRAVSGLKSIWLRWKFSISLAWSNGALLTGGGNRKSFRPSSSHTLKGLVKSCSERREGETEKERGVEGETEDDGWENIDGRQWEKRWERGTEEEMTRREILYFGERKRKIGRQSLRHDGRE